MSGILPYIAEDEDKQITFKYRDEIKAVHTKNIVSVTVYGHYLDIRLCDGTSIENRGTLATPIFIKAAVVTSLKQVALILRIRVSPLKNPELSGLALMVEKTNLVISLLNGEQVSLESPLGLY